MESPGERRRRKELIEPIGVAFSGSSSERRSGMKPCYVNLEDERSLITDMGVTPLVARRIVTARPFSDISALLSHVKGLTADMLVGWEARGISLDFSTAANHRHLGSSSRSTFESPLRHSALHVQRQQQQQQQQNVKPSHGSGGSVIIDPHQHHHGESKSLTAVHEQYLQASMQELNEFISGLQTHCSELEAASTRWSGGGVGGDLIRQEQRKKQWEARMMRVQTSSLRRSIRALVVEWRLLASRRTVLDRCEYRVLVRTLQRRLRRCFTEWLGHVRRLVRVRRIGVGTLSRVLARLRRVAFREWQWVCRLEEGAHREQAQAVSECETRKMTGVLQTWTENAEESKRLVVRVGRIEAKRRKISVKWCWEQWHRYTQGRGVLKRQGVRVMMRCIMLLGRCALEEWSSTARSRRLQRVRWDRLRFRSTCRVLRGAFHEWRYFVGLQPHASIRSSAGKFVAHYVGGIVTRSHQAVSTWAIRSWRDITRAQIVRRGRFDVMCHRKVVSLLSRTVDEWQYYSERRSVLQSKGVRLLVKTLKRSVWNAMVAWRECTQSEKRLWRSGELVASGGYGHQKGGKQQGISFSQRGGGGGRGRGEGRGGEGNSLSASPDKRERRVAAKRAEVVTHRYFTAWLDWRVKERRLQKLGIRMLVRWMRCLLSSMLHTWANITAEGRHGPRIEGLRALRARKSTLTMMRCITGWRVAVGDAEWNRSISVRISVRWTLMVLRRGFGMLGANASRASFMRGRVTRLMVKCWTRLVGQAIAGWAHRVKLKKRLWRAGGKVWQRWANLNVATCFGVWSEKALKWRESIDTIEKRQQAEGKGSRRGSSSKEGEADDEGEGWRGMRCLTGVQLQKWHLMAARRAWRLACESFGDWSCVVQRTSSPSALAKSSKNPDSLFAIRAYQVMSGVGGVDSSAYQAVQRAVSEGGVFDLSRGSSVEGQRYEPVSGFVGVGGGVGYDPNRGASSAVGGISQDSEGVGGLGVYDLSRGGSSVVGRISEESERGSRDGSSMGGDQLTVSPTSSGDPVVMSTIPAFGGVGGAVKFEMGGGGVSLPSPSSEFQGFSGGAAGSGWRDGIAGYSSEGLTDLSSLSENLASGTDSALHTSPRLNPSSPERLADVHSDGETWRQQVPSGMVVEEFLM